MDVIVLDGNQRSALAVTRSLGRRGLRVSAGAESKPSLASSSRYCSESFSYPSPHTDPDGFFHTLQEYVSDKSGVVLLPMTDVTLGEVLRRSGELAEGVRVPFVDHNTYESVSDKLNLFITALDLNLPMPKTLFPSSPGDRDGLITKAGQMGFPLVIKPARSRIRVSGGWIDTGVRYARGREELEKVVNNEPFKSHQFIIQERIEGPGIGIFLLMKEGEVLATFAHRRIREKPPSGGVSVLCESIEPPPVALDAATRLLRKFQWSGIAMVEFKLDRRDNLPKLMEVNARFWGSLQLAISAGVDFPYLLFRFARGEKIDPANDYRLGLKSRWELGDLDHLLIRMRKKSSELFLPTHAPARCKVSRDFVVDFFKPSIKNEVLRFDDVGPFLFESKEYIKNIVGTRYNQCAVK